VSHQAVSDTHGVTPSSVSGAAGSRTLGRAMSRQTVCDAVATQPADMQTGWRPSRTSHPDQQKIPNTLNLNLIP